MLVTKSEFARLIGVSAAAVGQAVKSGRLNTIAGKLDPKVAALQWEANRQRPPPMPVKHPPIISPKGENPAPPASSPKGELSTLVESPPIDWELENTGVWITMTCNRAGLAHIVENWISWADDRPINPTLVERLVGLLTDIADCVEVVKNPALWDERNGPD